MAWEAASLADESSERTWRDWPRAMRERCWRDLAMLRFAGERVEVS
jgi:hypothetical protein